MDLMQGLLVLPLVITLVSSEPTSGQGVVHNFAVDLFKSVNKITDQGRTDKNVALSPFSAKAALAMVFVGANGTTRSEIGSALGVADEPISVLALKLKSINAESQDYVLQSANGIFLEKTYEILPKFRSSVTDDFGANISTVDFVKQADQSRVQINSFVAEKTNNKIRDLFPVRSLDSDTRLVLVNAVYFKAQWANQFDKNATSLQPFTLVNNQTKQVPLMALPKTRLPYAQCEELGGAQLVELNYVGSTTSMVVILPEEQSDLAKLEKLLTAETLNSSLTQLDDSSRTFVLMFLPKFTISTEYDLIEPLKELGVNAAFGHADLSGISGKKDLMISKIVQKVFVTVDEEGTAAAAATAVVSKQRRIIPTVSVRADRPFLFLIRHKPTNSVLFLGRITDPPLGN